MVTKSLEPRGTLQEPQIQNLRADKALIRCSTTKNKTKLKTMIKNFILLTLLSLHGILQSQNLIENAGFENGYSSSYYFQTKSGTDVDIANSSTNTHTGDSALAVTITKIMSGGPQTISICTDIAALEAGKAYIFSLAIRAPSSGLEFRTRVEGSSRHDNKNKTESSYTVYTQKISSLCAANANGKHTINIQLGYAGNEGKWYFDDLDFSIDEVIFNPTLEKVFVSPTGSDSNTGELNKPLRTIAKAAEILKGDTIFLLEGVYSGTHTLKQFSGSAESPKVIMPYKGANVLMDGTHNIESSWTKYKGHIYTTTLTEDVWQLFNSQEMIMPARWPNASLKDGSVWDREENWGHGDSKNSTNGNFIDTGENNSLAATNINMTGAMAIMNIGSWKTHSKEILTHSAGANTFTYEPVNGYKTKHHYYIVENKLELLDTPDEWFYDYRTKQLYVWLPNNAVPDSNVRGKDKSYSVTFDRCDYIIFKGINFFASTFKFTNCTNSTAEDCKLEYASCSKRMLGLTSIADATEMTSSSNTPTYNAIVNCEISNTESHGVLMDGNTNRLENCYFENIDWVVADRPKLMNSLYIFGKNNIIRRNTVYKCGASSTIAPGETPIIELNRVSNTGYLQSDGSITQLVIEGQPNSETRYNWFHNTIKSGARFDAPIPPTRWGNNGAMHHNVVWETNSGLVIKGEYHNCFNNTIFNCVKNGIVILDDSEDSGGANKGSNTHNNFTDALSGGRNGFEAVPGNHSHNWNGLVNNKDYTVQMNDPKNMDFRPKNGSELIDKGLQNAKFAKNFIGSNPDIGAYEHNDTLYFIAGRKLAKASTPIPANNGTSNSERVDLMWLEGYKTVAHNVYFGTSRDEIESAQKDSPQMLGEFKKNIVSPGKLKSNNTYYWRVDAILSDGTINKGDTWEFIAGKSANTNNGDNTVETIITESEHKTIVITPTASNSTIELHGLLQEHYKYEIVTINCAFVSSGRVSRNNSIISIEALKAGQYLLLLGDGSKIVRRFIKI